MRALCMEWRAVEPAASGSYPSFCTSGNFVIPYKSTKKGPLDKDKKEYNHGLSRFRVWGEHAIRRIKTFRILGRQVPLSPRLPCRQIFYRRRHRKHHRP